MSLLEVQHLQKIYTTRFGGAQVTALADVNFSVEPGEYVAIMGESGSGKTTLLNILAALDRPTAGEVFLNGKALSDIRERDLAAFRRSHLGFVFQDFNLLDTFSLQDNIFLPLVLAGRDYREMRKKLQPIAEQLGIDHILTKYPYEVSGGQKQRCAVARALITDPQIVLADEPPGRWTPGPPTICWSSSGRSTRGARPSSWSPTPSRPPATPGGCSFSGTGRCTTSSTGAARAPRPSSPKSPTP